MRATKEETHLAPLPELCPSAITTETPPWGRSMTSTVSPLAEEAYFLTLDTAICTSMPLFYQTRWARMMTSFQPWPMTSST